MGKTKLGRRLKRFRYYFSIWACLTLPSLFIGIGSFWPLYNQTLLFLITLPLSLGFVTLLLRLWEKKMRKSVSYLVKGKLKEMKEKADSAFESDRFLFLEQIDHLQREMVEQKEKINQLNGVLGKKMQQMRRGYLEFEDMRKEYQRLEDEYFQLKEEKDVALSHKDLLIGEYQQTIAEQRLILEKKQRYVRALEKKIEDLTGEIKGLLEMTPEEDHTPLIEPLPLYATQNDCSVASSFDLSLTLSRYMDKAEKLTALERLGYPSHSLNSHIVDKRWLTDIFSDENQNIIFIYSQAEKSLLFVNPFVKSVLGWSPEKFIKEFPKLIIAGFSDWKMALSQVYGTKEAGVHLVIQNKLGKNVSFDCLISLIGRGVFAHHVMGILSPDMV